MLDDSSVNAVLGAAKLDELNETAYSIGPFGFRVGFTYQQRRALNLVCALVRQGRLKDTHKILIAGGGLAGIMAKMAFHGLGFGNVHLYEVRESILKVQHAANHRTLHPNYNNWPIADHFGPTSNLPFLNWYSSVAADVTSFLARRWEGTYSQHLAPVHTNHRLMGLTPTPPSKGRSARPVTAKFKSQIDGSEQEIEFDLAIVATGFGVERDLDSDADSYWAPDRIHWLRDQETEARKFIISGIGDGGLMDFIRFGYRTSSGDPDLALATISRLRRSKYLVPRTSLDDQDHDYSPVEKLIRRIENEAEQMLPQAPMTREDFGTDLENKIAQFLHDGYNEVIDILPPVARDFLEKSLHTRVINSGRLFLVGRLVQPFSCVTAPINKLLAAYLIRRRPSLYERGYLKGDKLITYRSEVIHVAGDVVVVRHGGQPPVYAFSTTFAEQSKQLSRDLANVVDIDRSGFDFCGDLQNITSLDPRSQQYRTYRKKLADEFASKRCGLSLEVVAGRRAGDDPFWFQFDQNAIPDVEEFSEKFGGFPHELFGVKLVAADPPIASNGLGRRK